VARWIRENGDYGIGESIDIPGLDHDAGAPGHFRK
jgi:hypothetical protein